MRVNRIVEKTFAEGPGCRFCIWVQGCNHNCEGCFATELWDYEKGYEISAHEIINRFQLVEDELDGITFLGGEPFDKASELSEVAKYVKSVQKNVITFTGYSYAELKGRDDIGTKALLENTDLLIDGEFVKEKTDYSRPLVGSSNQKFYYLGDGISKSQIENYKNRFELRYDEHGTIRFNGMGNVEKLKELIDKMKN